MSYRRSRRGAVTALAQALREHGVPTWQDIADLGSEPTVESLAGVLEHPHLSAGLLWLSEDVGTSPIILQEEAPRILERARARNGFRCHLVLDEGLDYSDVDRLLVLGSSIERPSQTWNIIRPEPRLTAQQRAWAVTDRVLQDRLADLHEHLPSGTVLPIRVFAHGQAKSAFSPGTALAIDWSPRFQHRHLDPLVWSEVLVPTVERIKNAVRTRCPGREVRAEGQMTISAALVLGRSFGQVGGIPLSWKQQPSGAIWTLAEPDGDSGLRHDLVSADVGSKELAVLLSVRGDVEPAVRATGAGVPAFRAILRLRTPGAALVDLDTPAKAAHAARFAVAQIREARARFPVVERVHLFLSGPAGLAMMIGQQLNAIGPVHTYEHDQQDSGVGIYRPAAILNDPV